MAWRSTGIILGALIAAAATAQAAPADHYSVADLTKMMQALKAKAAATGSASEKLQQYPNHFTMLAYRNKDGGGEIHSQFADIFYIVRGKAVVGGKSTSLAAGDVVHIPAGTPHQLLIAPGDELLYFVIKVKESN